MGKSEVIGGIESIEKKAEEILQDARSKAAEILRKASEESARILSEEISLQSVRAECDKIVRNAREQADREVAEAAKKAADMRSSLGQQGKRKADEVIARIIGAVRSAG